MRSKAILTHCVLTLLLLLKSINLFSNFDSIYFSKDGKYVLQTSVDNTHLNLCPCNYWLLYQADSAESTYYVTFMNDSVYFLFYDTIQNGLPYFRVNQCNTYAKVYKAFSLKNFENQYQLLIPSKPTFDSVVFITDTLKIRKVQYYENDSTLYYDIQVTAFLYGEKIEDQIVSTNVPIISHNYEVHNSQTENYYFVTGGFSVLEKTRDDLAAYERCWGNKLNKIGKIKKNNR